MVIRNDLDLNVGQISLTFRNGKLNLRFKSIVTASSATTGFSVFCLRGKWGESQKKNGGGRGGEGRNRLRTNPWILKTPVRWRTGLVIGWASRTFLTCVDQRS